MTTDAATLDDDREEWDRLWSGRTQRQVRPPLNLGPWLDPTLGELESVTIARGPDEILEAYGVERLGIETPLCPICGGTTIGGPRLFASLNLTFKNRIRYG